MDGYWDTLRPKISMSRSSDNPDILTEEVASHSNVLENMAAQNGERTVFDAVGSHDLEGVMQEYALNARSIVLSYLSMRKRWSARIKGHELRGMCKHSFWGPCVCYTLHKVWQRTRQWGCSECSLIGGLPSAFSFQPLQETTTCCVFR